MQQISSLQNPIVKMVHSLHQKKNRQEIDLFIIEGFKGVEDALRYGIEVTHVFLSENRSDEASNYPDDLLYLVSDKILKKISTTDSPCEVLAVAKQFKYRMEDLLAKKCPLIVVLEDVKDPGNLGTIIRTAKAADASGIILVGDAADIFNPKTVRSSVGNLWKIPIVFFEKKDKLKEVLSAKEDFQFIATSLAMGNKKSYFDIDYKKPSVLMFGSEAEGLSEILLNQADVAAEIPMNKEIESLNLSVSVGIILYEALRQK